jgi:phage tail sheath gpL-like
MIIIEGYTTDDKVPGAVAKNVWGAGRISIGAIALIVTCVGTMNEGSGAATVDTERVQVFDDDEAATQFGPRSEIARMLYAAIEVPGATVYGIAVDEPGGAVAATTTGVISGTWSTSGEIRYQFDEEVVRIAVGASDAIDTVGANIVSAVNQAQNGRLFCVASYVTGTDTLTFTVDSLGVRGNQHTAWLDLSDAPSGFALTLAGGTPLSNGGVPFSGGSGTDNVDNALTALEPTQNDYLAAAHNDSTNVGKIETAVNEKAAFDVGLLEQYHVSTNGALAGATSIAQTTMNDQLGSLHWVQWGVEHPSRIAARIAAYRSTVEGAQPNYNYDDVPLPGAAPHYRDADVPSRATLKTALNAGITPYKTVNGELQIVRAICSRSLNGSTPDYRTLDLGDVSVPIRIRKELVSDYQQLKTENPYAGPDTSTTDAPPEGTFTPNLWKNHAYARLKLWEGPDFNWVQEVDDFPPEAEWDEDAERVMSVIDTVVKSQNHQLGLIVRQRAA